MNLLLVDDEVYVVRTLQKKIDWERQGVDRVFTAFNVERAKEIFLQEKIDILLTDIEMPRESGMQLIHWVREQEKDCQMICLTCHAEFQYAQEALHYGVMEYVVKPIDFQKLSEIIHRAVLLQEENRKKKQQESQGCLWESNKQQIETAFWKDVLTGNAGENLDSIRKAAERARAEFDENEQYQLILLSVRKITDQERDWTSGRAYEVCDLQYLQRTVSDGVIKTWLVRQDYVGDPAGRGRISGKSGKFYPHL